MSFWTSDIGALTGTAEDAFSTGFGNIPDETMALAKIEKFSLQDYMGNKSYQINWKLTDGAYKGRLVFHKIHAFDQDSNRRHKALNMMMLIFQMFGVKPKDGNPPTDADLMQFVGKHAGIKIQEWEKDGKSGNWVSEVHPAQGFKSVTGVKIEVSHTHSHDDSKIESAFDRYNASKTNVPNDMDGDIPF